MRFGISALTALFLLTLATISGVLWVTNSSFQNFKSANESYFEAGFLKDTIVYIDEVLTMSARMAAVTGDLSWERRYRQYEPLLDNALAKAKRILPEIETMSMASTTEDANAALVSMENAAFDLIRQGEHTDAVAILFGSDYSRQKKIYAGSMNSFGERLTQRAKHTLVESQKASHYTILFSLFMVSMLFILWVRVVTHTATF